MKMNFCRSALVCCLTLLVVLPTGIAFGQDYRAKVQGMVTDASHAAVVGAKVTLRNMGTGLEVVRQTEATGLYVFDFVTPGTYSLSVEMAGFSKWTQENITVQTRGDVTVNASLTIGAVTETVNVSEDIAQVQFNSSTMTTMVTGQILKDIPVLARNPFTLALLNPAVINRYWDVSHRNPFYMWSNSGMDVGGNTGGKNDQLLDGVPLGYAARGSYNASMDAVQEVQVQQNAVDAEFGFGAGGTLNLSMKSGTNDWHGSGYYFGRNPYFNALQNRITRTKSTVRNHNWGGTLGNPIIKNKIFSYFSYEQWKSTQPQYGEFTLPTDLERAGDFSRSFTKTGALRTIYDPFTTQYDPATATVTRTPFAGNMIPASRIDPTGRKIMNDLPKPNNPGDDLTGINNSKNSYYWWLHYWNISERVDYNINDKWRMYARYSKYQTRLDNPNWGGTIAVRSDNGGIMDALNAAADVLYMMTPTTTIDFRYGAIYLEDDYDSNWAKVGESVWGNLFPTGWYKPVLQNVPGIYYPSISFSGNGSYSAGLSSWWQVHGREHTPSVMMTHDRGKHHMKAGWQLRYSYDNNGSPAVGSLAFNAVDTGNTFINFNSSLSGNQYASALLGVLNSGYAQINPLFHNGYSQWGLFFQDDVKLTPDITLNLGMRWETEQAPKDDHYMFSRYLDLTNPIPELQGGVAMPSEVTSIAKVNYKWNGAWMFTNSSNPRVYPGLNNFLPRAGIAIRINDISAVRFGYARYAVPMKGAWTEGTGVPLNGSSQRTDVLGPVQGVPQTLISDPFPAANPLRPPIGQGYGRYQDLGNAPTWFNQNLKRPINDRITMSYQRQLPWKLMSDTTFFMNFGHNELGDSMWGGNYGYDLNQIDPQLYYTYKGAMDAAVPNPFYQLLPADKMPGNLRNQKTVSVASLLRPYPQYPGALNQQFEPGISERYKALQIKIDRPFANGLSMTFGYNYNHESKSNWFNQPALYANDKTMFDMRNPRHTIRMAGTWELPIGRGRPYLNNVNRAVDLLIGGWATSHIFMWNQGYLLSFGQMNAPANSPAISNPTNAKYFDTSQFSQAAAYTPRTNPWYYDNLRGHGFWSLDSTAVKYFPITERVRLELRFEFFNTPNAFMPNDPNTSVTSSTFGKSTGVAGGNYGREVQYTARIHF